MFYKILLSLLLTAVTYPQDSLVFVIRVDDIQSRNTSYVPTTINYFQSAVEQRGGKITWAVIPHRLIEPQNSNGQLLKDLKQSILLGHETTMHGYNHICNNCGNSGHEMFCATNNLHFTYTQQSLKIDSSLKLLIDSVNIHPTSFVPPGHHNDSTTWQVLLNKGFEFISTTGPRKGFIYKNLFNLMQHQEYTWQLTNTSYQGKLKSALADIRAAKENDGYFCLLLHDPFIRQGYENGVVVRWIGELLDSVNKEYSGKVKYLTLKDAASRFKAQIVSVQNGSPTNIPGTFALEQNFPNPFNPSTVIRYNLPVAVNIHLSVFNALGKEVKVLADGFSNAGKHEIVCDMSGLPSGVYVYRIESSSFRMSKKLILLK
ncbi:MAG: DUF2334 domain-containing protein [Ignavibacteriales bacterium]|nr:DUF2334 domain-containing protein [Ignavibacteriales bacterium]